MSLSLGWIVRPSEQAGQFDITVSTLALWTLSV